jgi:hypothetical protein
MNVAQLETEMLSRNLQTFVMMLPNIAMWGDVSMAGEGFALKSLTEAVAGAVTGKLWSAKGAGRDRGDGGAALNVFDLTGATMPRPLRRPNASLRVAALLRSLLDQCVDSSSMMAPVGSGS